MSKKLKYLVFLLSLSLVIGPGASVTNASLTLSDLTVDSSGILNLGTSSATSVNIAKNGVNAIFNSNVGIGTTGPGNQLTIKTTTNTNLDYGLVQQNLDGNNTFEVASGRVNIYDYTGVGSILALYNNGPSISNGALVGHYAYITKNDIGNRNTIAYMASTIDDITSNSVDSSLTFGIMNNKDTTGGYSQPNQLMTYNSNGLNVGSTSINGVTNLIAQSANNLNLKTTSSNSIVFYLNSNQAARFDSGGNLELNNSKTIYTTDNGNLTFIPNGTGNVLITNGSVGIGTTSPGQKLEINGGIRLNTTTAKPTCDSTVRGTFWSVQGGTGVKDTVEVCAKDATDAYAWRPIY